MRVVRVRFVASFPYYLGCTLFSTTGLPRDAKRYSEPELAPQFPLILGACELYRSCKQMLLCHSYRLSTAEHGFAYLKVNLNDVLESLRQDWLFISLGKAEKCGLWEQCPLFGIGLKWTSQ